MKRLYVYLHTHWDREWYQPFETYRVKLVDTVRSVISGLVSGDLPSFYLDGQASVLDDVLEIEPELAGDIRRLMLDGKLFAGPWYVLADQMLVSGESLVRNLKHGLEVTRKYGHPSMVGYCPDTFGHTQDLPRILAGFGINTAVVWRGVPAEQDYPLFRWVSPDGSGVTALVLSRGYYQTAVHEPRSAEELGDYLRQWVDNDTAPSGIAPAFCEHAGCAVFPAGGDHVPPPVMAQAKLHSVQAYWKMRGIDAELACTSLEEAMTALTASGMGELNTIQSELRDNKFALGRERAYMLQGVLSSRLYLKTENRLAEHRLISVMEPLLTLLQTEKRMGYPAAELRQAWKYLLQNQPHDSICGCSVDAVHNEMITRYRALHHLLDGLETKATARVATDGSTFATSPRDAAYPHNRLVVYNLCGEETPGPIRMNWYEEPDSKDIYSENPAYQIIRREVKNELFTEGDVVPYYKQVEKVEAWVDAGELPACGFQELSWPITIASSRESDVIVEEGRLSNGLLSVAVDASGCISVEHGGNRYRLGHTLRDLADCGDTYNFDPIPGDKPVLSTFLAVAKGDRGPLVGSLYLTQEMNIPRGSEPASDGFRRSPGVVRHEITTEISLRRGVPVVFFRTDWENYSADHRLEVLFDTGVTVDQTFSENHFSVVRREHAESQETPLPVAAGTEAPLDRYPCQRFFIAHDQLFLNVGLPEYGVEGSSVSITLLRATSMLSREKLLTRGGGAGPYLRTPGANCFGANSCSYGWAPLCTASGGIDDAVVQAYRLAEQFEGRTWAALAHRETKERARSVLKLDNPALRLMSLHMPAADAGFIVRLLNVTSSPQSVLLRVDYPCKSLTRCNLEGEAIETIYGSADNHPSAAGALLLPLKAGPNELLTLRIT